ncbi:MAG TPA: ScyD/ScyE family protein [Longimicrobiales bacterium]|nr:ScyD/ScyE family protein [Longimicrobiales bacterium]
MSRDILPPFSVTRPPDCTRRRSAASPARCSVSPRPPTETSSWPTPVLWPPPMLPADPVPTSVAVGPDGHYYVGELKGFPAPAGESNIWRVSPGASWAACGSSPDCVKVFDDGFTSIIDLAFDADGHLLVAELDEASWLAVEVLGIVGGGTVNRCDTGTLTCGELATGIPILTAITVGRDGVVWATRNALIPGLASVVGLD